MRVSIGMMYGCFGLPIPRHKQIMMVCGKPVAPGPAMSPEDPKFKDQVDKVHQELVDAMSSLYARHAEDFGWDYQNRPLVIE